MRVDSGTELQEPGAPKRQRGRPRGAKDSAPRVEGGRLKKERALRAQARAEKKEALRSLEEAAEAERAAKREAREDRGFLREPHGAAKEKGRPGPRVQTPEPGEIGLDEKLIESTPRRPRGPFVKGHKLGSSGGKNKRGKVTLVASLGITQEMAARFPAELHNALRKGASYRRVRNAELAHIAGGAIGAGPSAMIANAALALAGSRHVFGLAALETDPDLRIKYFSLFSKLMGEHRQCELAGHSMAILEGKARMIRDGAVDPLERFRRALPPRGADPLGAPERESDQEPSNIIDVSPEPDKRG